MSAEESIKRAREDWLAFERDPLSKRAMEDAKESLRMAALALFAAVDERDALRKRVAELELLAEHSGAEHGRREWHSVGAWLYPGDRIVLDRAPETQK